MTKRAAPEQLKNVVVDYFHDRNVAAINKLGYQRQVADLVAMLDYVFEKHKKRFSKQDYAYVEDALRVYKDTKNLSLELLFNPPKQRTLTFATPKESARVNSRKT